MGRLVGAAVQSRRHRIARSGRSLVRLPVLGAVLALQGPMMVIVAVDGDVEAGGADCAWNERGGFDDAQALMNKL